MTSAATHFENAKQQVRDAVQEVSPFIEHFTQPGDVVLLNQRLVIIAAIKRIIVNTVYNQFNAANFSNSVGVINTK